MITRDISGTFYVPAFDRKMFGSCAATRYDPCCGYNPQMCDGVGTERSGWNGRIIDRLSLPTGFTNARVIATSLAVLEHCSTGVGAAEWRANYVGLAVGLDHNCSTGAGWTAFSTASWSAEKPGYLLSTAGSTQDGYLGTSSTTSTSLNPMAFVLSTSARGVVSAEAIFDLTAAKRFIRVVVTPRIESTGCSIGLPVEAGILFGGAANAPAEWSGLTGKLIVTTGCSTST